MLFSVVPQLSSGHKYCVWHSQPDYDIMSFPKSKGKLSFFLKEFSGLGCVFFNFIPQRCQGIKF